jgi:dTMP kinase
MGPLTTPTSPTKLSVLAEATGVGACARGPLISVEGITGVGKTYLTERALETFEIKPLLLGSFSQRSATPANPTLTRDPPLTYAQAPSLGKVLLRALREASEGDPFLRGGTPITEALLLIAIKRHDLDTVLPDLAGGRCVIEGRSIDTTAVCQALQLHPDDPGAALEAATALLQLARGYRPLPDLTILVTDDPDQAIARTQQRDQRTLTPEQATFMRAAGALFERLAATEPGRYQVLDRRTVDEHQGADLIRTRIHDIPVPLGCISEPWQEPAARCMFCGHATGENPQAPIEPTTEPTIRPAQP